MARNLIVFADGTGNSAAKSFKTNVWRLYQALDLSSDDQIAVFDDGVGTSSFRPLQILGLAIGYGVKRNVLDLYKFLCLNYQGPEAGRAGDRIYAFGFSRGAFTIRVLVALIRNEGLVTFRSEEELNRNALEAYRSYRRKCYPARFLPWVRAGRFIRDLAVGAWRRATNVRLYDRIQAETAEQGRRSVNVEFLGLWDTVSAYGLPIDELTTAFDRWVWPMKFREQDLPQNVLCARHALSLDDERRTFFPIPWSEKHLPPRQPGQSLHQAKLLQVWFAGVHANVGGGYPDDGLAHVSLGWMIREATAHGLRFQPWMVDGYRAVASDCGPIYDPREGAGAFYRYQPRDVDLLMNSAIGSTRKPHPSGERIVPLVDSSVVLRMAFGNDGYVPISLPERIDILTPDGLSVPFDDDALALLPPPPAQQSPAAPPSPSARLASALELLAPSLERETRQSQLALVLDTVWWRRAVYFVTLGLALLAAAYPLLGGYIRWAIIEDGDTLAYGGVAEIVRWLSGVLPSAAKPWLDSIAEWPTWAAIIAMGIVVSLGFSRWLQRRIRDRARAAWSVRAGKDVARLDKRRREGQQTLAFNATLFFVACALALLLITQSPDQKESPALINLAWGMWGLVALCLLTWINLRFRENRNPDPAAPGGLLTIARWLRLSPAMRGLYRLMAQYVFPAIFLVGTAFLGIMVVNRVAFDLWNSTGRLCEARLDEKAAREAEKLDTDPPPFDTKSLCWASGLALSAGAHYRIWIEPPADLDWFDRTVQTGVEGFADSGSSVHTLFTLTKRSWSQNWFKPIVRIGRKGNDEYALHPLDPLPPPPKRHKGEPDPVPVADTMGNYEPAPESEARRVTADRWRGAPPRILVAEITPRKSGELFLYVNDSVLAIPGLVDLYYRNNLGTAKVKVERVKAPPPPDRP